MTYADEIVRVSRCVVAVVGVFVSARWQMQLNSRCDGIGVLWGVMDLISRTCVRSELKITCRHRRRG